MKTKNTPVLSRLSIPALHARKEYLSPSASNCTSFMLNWQKGQAKYVFFFQRKKPLSSILDTQYATNDNDRKLFVSELPGNRDRQNEAGERNRETDRQLHCYRGREHAFMSRNRPTYCAIRDGLWLIWTVPCELMELIIAGCPVPGTTRSHFLGYQGSKDDFASPRRWVVRLAYLGRFFRILQSAMQLA